MTSLEDEFKNILGEKYQQIHRLESGYRNPFLNRKDQDDALNQRIDFQNSLLNNESSTTTSNDFVNASTNLIESAPSRKNQFSNIYSNIELKQDIINLLEKVDKILEYLEYSNRQIDEKIKKALDDLPCKRENPKE